MRLDRLRVALIRPIDDLDGDATFDNAVHGVIDRAHGAGAERAAHLVFLVQLGWQHGLTGSPASGIGTPCMLQPLGGDVVNTRLPRPMPRDPGR